MTGQNAKIQRPGESGLAMTGEVIAPVKNLTKNVVYANLIL
jgi:hypothetical protein